MPGFPGTEESAREAPILNGLNENDPLPLYHQLKKILSEKILNKEWGPEMQIPTEGQLVEEYGVSRSTVRSAVLDLMRSGVLYRKRGKGTFVSPSKVSSEGIPNLFFSREYEADDFHKNIGISNFPAGRWIAEILGIHPGENIFEFLRVRYFRNEMAAIEKIFIPVKFCPDLPRNLPAGKFSDWLLRNHGMNLKVKEKIIEATIFDKEESRILGVKHGSPALLYIRVKIDSLGSPVYLSKTLLRGDRFRIRIPTAFEGVFINRKD